MVTLSGGPMEKRRRQEQQQQQQQQQQQHQQQQAVVMQPRPLFPEMERGYIPGNVAHVHPINSHYPTHHHAQQQQVFQGMSVAEREDKIEMLTRENAMLKV